jgi:spermidine synthase
MLAVFTYNKAAGRSRPQVSMESRRSYAVLLFALFVSGASGLINQTAWQRAVKVYLGNSETISSTLVVLVFMLGLGSGSLYAARWVPSLTRPFRQLAMVEIVLALVNGALIFLFGEEMRSWSRSLLLAASDVGVPAAVVYGFAAFVVLIVPCFLMGVTIPLAAEAAQRQLTVARNKALSDFFFLNTAGAVIGALVCGLLLMPVFGQKAAMAVASGGNVLAGALLLFLLAPLPAAAMRKESSDPMPLQPRPVAGRRPIQSEIVLAFVLGAFSLSYEIYLFRIVALTYTPLPWIFCVVLSCFLLFWSLGVALSERVETRISSMLLLTAVAVAIVPYDPMYLPIWITGLVYFLPCVGFGMLFGMTLARYANQWGRDVGVFTALNTAGTAAGILITTFVLFEIDKDLNAWIISLGLAAFALHFLAREKLQRRVWRLNAFVAVVLAVFLVRVSLGSGMVTTPGRVEFYGRDGVVEIYPSNNYVYIDGLWHSVLYRDDDQQIKNTENVRRKMLIAILPFLAHDGDGRSLTALNIGMGTGATARTLAKSSSIESVDAYEIVDTVREVIRHYPLHTLRPADLEKINVYWEDARSGLLLRDKKYDIITQSPLYLRQAGSSLLLSREYFQLIRSRLKEGGIVGIYSNSLGNEEQALLVRKTVSEVFRYYESFAHGYFILASDSPIRVDRQHFEAKLREGDPIADDVRILGIDWLLQRMDRPRLNWTDSPYVITDDHPLVEYPQIASRLIRSSTASPQTPVLPSIR